ncbi:hypothetical protein DSO57_1012268 [Entomophthora muscae]|nr:hypothetical protein DSO57_1012268 [Entomophthora muscae]
MKPLKAGIPPPVSDSQPAKKARVLDEFMVELKRQQEERNERLKTKQVTLPGGGTMSNEAPSLTLKAAFEDHSDPLDGDPTSTNLYLSNICSEADENAICRAFGKFGPIASVKIMWPRTQEERERNRNCGFVSFMDRASALAAKKQMDGFLLLGQFIRVSWGKPVPIPPIPMFDINSKPVFVRSGLPFNARPSILMGDGQKSGAYKFVPPPGSKRASQALNSVRLEVHVKPPTDPCVLALIHRVIERVCVYGYAFEGLIMQREAQNEKFKFLFDFDTPEHVYYRWKLYSLLQGDPIDSWRNEPFRMFDDGPFFIPPKIFSTLNDVADKAASSGSSSPAAVMPSETKGKLNTRQRDDFLKILNELTVDRQSIGFAMVAALERVSEAEEIASLIQDHLLKEDLPSTAALAILYLISDILHNVNPTVPQAWRLRAELEKRMPIFFKQLHKVYGGISRRLRAESFRRLIAAIFPIWESSLIFPAPFLYNLKNIFHHGSSEAPKEVYVAPLNPQSESDSIDGEPCEAYDEVDGIPVEDAYDDIDGVPLTSQQIASDDDMFA